MKRPILLVLALEQENHDHRLSPLADEVIYTGVGKVNATLALTRALSGRADMPLVINVGSAGSHSFSAGEVVNPVEFVQRDMDCTAMGVPLGQTPFEDRKRLKNGLEAAGIPTTTCYTGDSFVTEAHPVFHLEVIDMEAYALARVCDAFDAPFLCLKFVTDGADGEAAEDWSQAVILSAHRLEEALKLALRRLHG
jgi:adenosylhomocysteine nucleosidase